MAEKTKGEKLAKIRLLSIIPQVWRAHGQHEAMDLVAAAVAAPPDGVMMSAGAKRGKNLLLGEGGKGCVHHPVQFLVVVFVF
jgi:hypothetical protein